MAIKASFLNDGTAHSAVDFGAYFNKFVTDGVYTSPASGLSVENTSGLSFTVHKGSAFVLGVWVELTEDMALVADSTPSTRVDRIVVDVDHDAATAGIKLLKGTDGSTTPPSLATGSTRKQICLAEFTVTTLGVTRTVDTRSDTTLCGFTHNFLGNLDASGLFSTWNGEFERQSANAQEVVTSIEQNAQNVFAQISAETAGLYGSVGRQGFMNPAFRVNQRGLTSYQATTGTQITYDRWLLRIGGRTHAKPVTVSRQQDGIRSAVKIDTTKYEGTSGSGASGLIQTIEDGCRIFTAGGTFTVSFDARATLSQRLMVEPMQFPDINAAGVTIKAQGVNLTTEWQRYNLTFTGTVKPTAEQADALKIGFYFAWTSYVDRFGAEQNAENTIYLANMQINQGDKALPAYIPPVANDVTACRRYYRHEGLTQLVVGAQTTTARQTRTQTIDYSGMRSQPTVTFADRNNKMGVASLFTVAGIHVDNCAAFVTNNRDKSASLVITNPDVTAVAAVLGSIDANAEYMTL